MNHTISTLLHQHTNVPHHAHNQEEAPALGGRVAVGARVVVSRPHLLPHDDLIHRLQRQKVKETLMSQEEVKVTGVGTRQVGAQLVALEGRRSVM